MFRWAFLTSLVSLTAFGFHLVTTPPPPLLQPIQFSHKVHLDYFWDKGENGHRQTMLSMHKQIFTDYRDGHHKKAMIARHKELLIKDLEDEDLVAQMIKEQISPGYCNLCHRDFDENARDLDKLDACAQCHRRKESGNQEFAAHMIDDVDAGHCELCHRKFDRNVGQNASRLSACAKCHEHFAGEDWNVAGRQRVKPCMGCHNAVFEHFRASIPNTDHCVACHLSPLGDNVEETRLVRYVEQKEPIGWQHVYAYLPSEIVFSHERHTEIGQVACQKCHGHVELATRPLTLDVKLRMDDCMNCHKASGVSTDCLACHR